MNFLRPKSKSKLKVDSSIMQSRALRDQFPIRATPETKIRLAVMATAMVDALGGPVEFKKRFTFDFVTKMLPNENFPEKLEPQPGIWSDTASILCLARSLAATTPEDTSSEFCGGFDEANQLKQYRKWYENGYFTPTGICFNISSTTKAAIEVYANNEKEYALRRIRADFTTNQYHDNGSLVRVLPLGLSYWIDYPQAKIYAKRSSQATHPATICTEACEVWAGAICGIMAACIKEPRVRTEYDNEDVIFSKLNVLEYFSSFPFTDNHLRTYLTLPFGVPMRPEGRAEREAWYYKHHPLLRIITETQSVLTGKKDPRFPYNIPSVEALPSSNHVLHTIVAALYCFMATRTFEEGAIMAVNLGDDANTVGAVYAGLAACFYAGEEGSKAEGVFWTTRVREWRRTVARPDIITRIMDYLVEWEMKVREEFG